MAFRRQPREGLGRWAPLALALLLAGCGGGAVATPTPPPSPTPFAESAQEVLTRASQAIASLRSFHFLMEVIGGTIPLIEEYRLDRVEGEMERPDRWKATLRVPLQGGQSESQIVGVGGRVYVTHPESGRWVRYVTPVDPPALFHPNRGVQAMLGGLVNPLRLPDTPVDGVDTYHIRGTSSARFFEFMTGPSVPGAALGVDLWIGKHDGHLRLVRLDGRIVQGDSPAVIRLIRLSRFDRPVDIRLPE